jgi:phosphoglycolate phosphatase-like HAD superfamily hydrolase
MIGDSAKDIECARNAGCGQTVLVKTGNGSTAEGELTGIGITPDYAAAHLGEAADWVVKVLS